MKIKASRRVSLSVLVAGFIVFTFPGSVSANEEREAQWPLESFVSAELWSTSTGSGVTVGVVDLGFRPTHQDLNRNILPGKEFGELEGGGSPYLDEGADFRDHGTSMATLIAGHGHGSSGENGIKGIAPDSKIIPISTETSEARVAEAIRHAVDEGAKVVNVSLALADSPPLEQAVNYAVAKDVVLVAGVGNVGSAEKSYPASYPGVVGIGSVDKYGKVWEDSNTSSVDLLAPGVDIVTTGGQADDHYRMASGTSPATAYASGAAALIRAEHPELTAGQVANRLVKTAGLPDEMQGKKLPDKRYGYGFIRPRAALTDDIPAGPKDGPLPMPKAGDEGALKPTTGDGSTGSILEEWGPLVGGVGLGAIVVVGGIVWLVSRSRGGARAPATGAGPTGMPNYPAQQGSQAYPAPPPMNQPPPMPPGGQPPQMPPPGPGQYNQGGPGPYSG